MIDRQIEIIDIVFYLNIFLFLLLFFFLETNPEMFSSKMVFYWLIIFLNPEEFPVMFKPPAERHVH